MTTNFDEPRKIPESVLARWAAEGLWSGDTVSDVINAPQEDLGANACIVDEQHYSLGGLRTWSQQLADSLRSDGVGPGDRILIQLPNCVEQVASILAAWHLGAIAVPVLPLLRARELAGVVRQIKPAAVIVADARGSRRPTIEFESSLAGYRPRVRWSVGNGTPGWSRFPEPNPQFDSAAVAPLPGFDGPDACVLVLFTSGTTAGPKGVRHDSRSLLAEVGSYRSSASLTDRDVVFNPAPIAHIGAVVTTVLVPWLIGSPVVLLEQWDSAKAHAIITREKVTFAVGAPLFLRELVQLYESQDYIGHRVERFQTGAAPTSADLLVRADAIGVTAWRAWGMTEAPTMSYGTVSDPLDKRANFDGRVEPGTEVVAADENGDTLAPGYEGELWIRSPKQMLGYLALDDEHQPADGWMRTGDLGTVDADGWVTITGRLKDIINRGGEKFSAREVENAICEHPAIESAAVVGVPEPRLGEQVVAYVVVREDIKYPGFDAIIDHLVALRIAAQKFPVKIIVMDAFPVTPTGKVKKRTLVDLWVETK